MVRYDANGAAQVALRDSTSREWPVTLLSSPATRVFWLDQPHLDSETRHALSRAFDEASAYGVDARVAALAKLPVFLSSCSPVLCSR